MSVMAVPLAMSPGRSPGLGLVVNFLAEAASPGSGTLRGCVIACKSSAGTITAGTQLERAIGPNDALTLLGANTPGYIAIKRLFEEHALAQIDLVSPAVPSGVAASQTIVFDDAGGAATDVTVAQDVVLDIAGREAIFTWLPGETAVQAATKCVAAVSALGADCPVTAGNSSGTLDTVTLTFPFIGKIGNDVTVAVKMSGGTGGEVVATGATLASGTGDPTLTTALSTISGTEYDYILLVDSNYDATLASSTSGVGRVKSHVVSLGSGMGAKLQQIIVGVTGSLSAAKTGTAQHNFGQLQYPFCNAGRSLPCEWAAAEMGARMREESIDPTVNRIGMPYRATLYGAKDLVANTLTAAQVEDALLSGVSPVGYDTTGAPFPIRPVTTYFKDTAGNTDDRILDTSRVSGIFAVAKDIRVSLPQQFPQKKLSADLPDGQNEIPPGVVEVREIKSFVIERLIYWAKTRGVLNIARLQEAIGTRQSPGTLIVEVDPTDESQCNIVLPMKTIRPLARFSVVANQAA